MSIKDLEPYEASQIQSPTIQDYRWCNIRLALYASIPQFVGGVLSLAVSALLAFAAVREVGEPNWTVLDSLVCLPLAIVAATLSALQFRAIVRLVRQGWNSPTRKIQRPGKSEWDHFGPSR